LANFEQKSFGSVLKFIFFTLNTAFNAKRDKIFFIVHKNAQKYIFYNKTKNAAHFKQKAKQGNPTFFRNGESLSQETCAKN
jgi:hypothetical protein